MDDLSVIDRFTETFLAFIDSGFGLLGPDVGFLLRILVSIDIALVGLAWAMQDGTDVAGQLVRKVLYVGAFALILNNYALLADIVFRSFADLGLEATGNPISARDLLRPGFVANVGVEAAHPLLAEVESLIGFPDIVVNAPEVLLLLLAWGIVVMAFFVLAVQVFVTLVEFKLTAVAGFVLVPFALWGRTAFLAERVLSHVAAAGIKVMVLAIVIGIGSQIFQDVTLSFQGAEVTIQRALPLVLASLALLGIGIHGPAIARGLVTGGPQLDAGSANRTLAAASVPLAMAGGWTVRGGRAGAGAVVSAVRSGARNTGAAASAATGASGVVRATRTLHDGANPSTSRLGNREPAGDQP